MRLVFTLKQKMCQKICIPEKSRIFAPLLSNVLGYGVMVTLQILVLPFLVRVRVAQQKIERRQCVSFLLGYPDSNQERRERGRAPSLSFLFLICSANALPSGAWRPYGTAVSLQAFARTNTLVPAFEPALGKGLPFAGIGGRIGVVGAFAECVSEAPWRIPLRTAFRLTTVRPRRGLKRRRSPFRVRRGS